jgi:hypothetical protein
MFGGIKVTITGEVVGRIILTKQRDQRLEGRGGRGCSGRTRRKERGGMRAICTLLEHARKEG